MDIRQATSQEAMRTAYASLKQALLASAAFFPRFDYKPCYPNGENKQARQFYDSEMQMLRVLYNYEWVKQGYIGDDLEHRPLYELSNAAYATFRLAQHLAREEIAEINRARQRVKRKKQLKDLEALVGEARTFETPALVLLGTAYYRQAMGSGKPPYATMQDDKKRELFKKANGILTHSYYTLEHGPEVPMDAEDMLRVRHLLFQGLVNARIGIGLDMIRQGYALIDEFTNAGYEENFLKREEQGEKLLAGAAEEFRFAEEIYDKAAAAKVPVLFEVDVFTTDGEASRVFRRLNEYAKSATASFEKIIANMEKKIPDSDY